MSPARQAASPGNCYPVRARSVWVVRFRAAGELPEECPSMQPYGTVQSSSESKRLTVKSRNPMRWIGIRTFVLFYHEALIAFIYDDRSFRLVMDSVSTGFFSATA